MVEQGEQEVLRKTKKRFDLSSNNREHEEDGLIQADSRFDGYAWRRVMNFWHPRCLLAQR